MSFVSNIVSSLFGDTPQAPPAPNYAQIAQTQGAANVDTARAQARLNNANIYTPYGTQTVTWNGDTPTIQQNMSQAGYDLLNQQNAMSKQLGNTAQSQLSRVDSAMSQPFNMANVTARSATPQVDRNVGAAPQTSNFQNGWQYANYGQSPTLSNFTGPAGTSNFQGAPGVSSLQGQFNTSNFERAPGAANYSSAPGPTASRSDVGTSSFQGGPSQSNFQNAVGTRNLQYGTGTSQFQNSVGTSQFQNAPGTAQYNQGLPQQSSATGTPWADEAGRRSVANSIYQRASQPMERQNQLQTNAALIGGHNRGGAAMNAIADDQSRARNDLALAADAAGGAEQSRLFGLGMQTAQQTEAEKASRFGQQTTIAGMGDTRANTQYGQQFQNAQMNNQNQQNLFSQNQQNAQMYNQNQAQNFSQNQQNAQMYNQSARDAFAQDTQNAQMYNQNQQAQFAQGTQNAQLANQNAQNLFNQQSQNADRFNQNQQNLFNQQLQGTNLNNQNATNVYNQQMQGTTANNANAAALQAQQFQNTQANNATQRDVYGQSMQNAQFNNQNAQNLYAQQMQNAQFANTNAQNLYGQQMQNAQLGDTRANTQLAQNNQYVQNANQNQQALYGQQMQNAQLRDQQNAMLFNQGTSLYGLTGQAQAQDIQQQAYLRSLPLNELNALRSGSQATMPQFQQYSGGGQIAPPPIMQGAQLNYQAALGPYNQQLAQQQSAQSGLFQLGAAALPYAFSDRRLKSGIERVGEMENGLAVYDYTIEGRRERGVMADEVLQVLPAAIGHDARGYMMVNYAMIGG